MPQLLEWLQSFSLISVSFPTTLGSLHMLFMIGPAGPEPVLPARQWTKDLIMAVQVDDKAERSSQTFLVKRELCL